MIISGSLLNADQANLVSCVHLAEKGGIDEIHFDVTNGIYVRNISFGPQTVADVQKIASVPVDIHLELDNTLDMIDLYGPLHPGCITVQADSTPHPLMTFRKIHSFGARVGFALNPSISPSQYEYCLPYIDRAIDNERRARLRGAAFCGAYIQKDRRGPVPYEEVGHTYPYRSRRRHKCRSCFEVGQSRCIQTRDRLCYIR